MAKQTMRVAPLAPLNEKELIDHNVYVVAIFISMMMSKLAEGQSVYYAAIHVAKIGLSPYAPGTYKPLKRDRGPPCGGAVTIDGECPYICRLPAREKNFYYQKLCHSYIAIATKLMPSLPS
jgi:hypothetical protein